MLKVSNENLQKLQKIIQMKTYSKNNLQMCSLKKSILKYLSKLIGKQPVTAFDIRMQVVVIYNLNLSLQ